MTKPYMSPRKFWKDVYFPHKMWTEVQNRVKAQGKENVNTGNCKANNVIYLS